MTEMTRADQVATFKKLAAKNYSKGSDELGMLECELTERAGGAT